MTDSERITGLATALLVMNKRLEDVVKFAMNLAAVDPIASRAALEQFALDTQATDVYMKEKGIL